MKKTVLTIVLGLSAAFGNYTMVMKNKTNDNVTQTVKYQDDEHMNFISQRDGRPESAFYVIGEKAYSVNYSGDEITYIDVDEMREMLNAFGNAGLYLSEKSYQERKDEMQFKVIRKKGSTTVAGIRGETWVVSYMQDGKKITEEIVVTKDKGVKKIYRSWGVLFNRVFQPEEPVELEKYYEVESGYVAIKSKDMEVASFSDDAIDPSELKLPEGAKQQSMPNFSAMFGGASEDEAAQTEDAADEAESESEEESGSGEAERKAVNEGVDEAVELFKSLF